MEKKIRPLKSIKTNEEYEEYKKYLDGYLIEYKWYKSHGKSEARDLIIKKAENYENDSELQKRLLYTSITRSKKALTIIT